MTRPRRTPTDAELPEILDELRRSGSTIASFARERGLAPWKLYKGMSARSTSPARGRTALVPVRLVGEGRPIPPSPLELVLSSGHRLVVPPDFDEGALRRLMGVLASC